MIDRYSISISAGNVKDRFAIEVPEFYKPQYNAAPTHLLPVITSNSPQGISLFYWGTSPEWSKNKALAEKMINTRTENFKDKPTLLKALRKNRCLIPADGFYGWKKVGKKTAIPHRFILQSGEAFGIAGLWEEFEDTEGNEIQTFTIITQPANEVVSSVQDRMPVILEKHSEKMWLDNDTVEENLLQLLSISSTAKLDFYPVSPGISDSNLNLASLIIPTPPSDQHGNLTLFD